MKGKFYGIGVGPGDPKLVTLKAVEILKTAGHIFVPISRANKRSLAFDIAAGFIPEETPVTDLLCPMIKDKEVLQRQWMENFKQIERVVRHGKDAAFLTLGDPSTYSTYSGILKLFKRFSPDITIETIPGITSFAHAAAKTGTPLVEGNQILSVVSANGAWQRIEAVLDASDAVVFLKTYKDRELLLNLLKKKGLLDCCKFIRRCGLEGEEVADNLEDIPAEPDYLSLIILRKSQKGKT